MQLIGQVCEKPGEEKNRVKHGITTLEHGQDQLGIEGYHI